MCEMLKEKLDASEIEYEVCRDVDRMKELGITHVPMLQTDEGNILSVGDALKLVKEITRNDC